MGERAKAVKHDMNFCNVFNLISFTISNQAELYLLTKWGIIDIPRILG